MHGHNFKNLIFFLDVRSSFRVLVWAQTIPAVCTPANVSLDFYLLFYYFVHFWPFRVLLEIHVPKSMKDISLYMLLQAYVSVLARSFFHKSHPIKYQNVFLAFHDDAKFIFRVYTKQSLKLLFVVSFLLRCEEYKKRWNLEFSKCIEQIGERKVNKNLIKHLSFP